MTLLTSIHIEHRLDCEYFLHLFYFPHRRKLPDVFFDNLIGEFTWQLTGSVICIYLPSYPFLKPTFADTTISSDSHASFGHAELERFLTVLKLSKGEIFRKAFVCPT